MVDHFSRGATDLVLRDFDRMLFGGDMAPLLRRNGGDVFEDSYEVEHGPVGRRASRPSSGRRRCRASSPAAAATR